MTVATVPDNVPSVFGACGHNFQTLTNVLLLQDSRFPSSNPINSCTVIEVGSHRKTSHVGREFQKMDVRARDTVVDVNSPPWPNQPAENEDRFHNEYSQSWPAINSKRSATPPSYFSDQQTQDLLKDSSIILPTRSAVLEQCLDELGTYGVTSVDSSEVRHVHSPHASVKVEQQYYPEIANSEDHDITDGRAADDISQYLKDVSASPSRDATAFAMEADNSECHNSPVTSRKQSQRGQKRKSNELHAADDDLDERPARMLRERTVRQVMPFKMDKAEHKHVRSGNKKTETHLEEEVVRDQIHGRKKQARKPVTRGSNEKAKTTRPLAQRGDLPSPTPTPSAITDTCDEPEAEPDVFQTTIRTRLKEFGKGHLPIMLPKARSTAALFKTIQQKWHRGLNGREIHHCVISFPWLEHLGEDEDMIMFGEDGNEECDSMLEKIKAAPTWRDYGRCEIDLMIHPEAKH